MKPDSRSPTFLIRERPLEIVSRRAWLQSRIDAAFRTCREHDPRFRLAALARRDVVRLAILGMHLNREHIIRVEELEEYGEPAGNGPPVFPAPGRRLFDQLLDGPAISGPSATVLA